MFLVVPETETFSRQGSLFREDRTVASTCLKNSSILDRWQCFEKAQEEVHTIKENCTPFNKNNKEAQQGHPIS